MVLSVNAITEGEFSRWISMSSLLWCSSVHVTLWLLANGSGPAIRSFRELATSAVYAHLLLLLVSVSPSCVQRPCLLGLESSHRQKQPAPNQEPITRSVQRPYSFCETAFSQVGLFFDKPLLRISSQKPIRSERISNNKPLMPNYKWRLICITKAREKIETVDSIARARTRIH